MSSSRELTVPLAVPFKNIRQGVGLCS
jgi:hypothetical protein